MWKNLNINLQNIETQISNAALIKMPNNSKYAGYVFWHPSKLIRDGRNSNAISIGYNESFNFKLRKYGKGKHNKSEIIDEINIDAEEFEDAFCVINENITSKKYKNNFETHKPKELVIKEIKVLEELKDL